MIFTYTQINTHTHTQTCTQTYTHDQSYYGCGNVAIGWLPGRGWVMMGWSLKGKGHLKSKNIPVD